MLFEFKTLGGGKALIDPTEIKSLVEIDSPTAGKYINAAMRGGGSFSLAYDPEYFDKVLVGLEERLERRTDSLARRALTAIDEIEKKTKLP